MNVFGNMGMSLGTRSLECVVILVGLQVGLNIVQLVHILHTVIKIFNNIQYLIYNIALYMLTNACHLHDKPANVYTPHMEKCVVLQSACKASVRVRTTKCSCDINYDIYVHQYGCTPWRHGRGFVALTKDHPCG